MTRYWFEVYAPKGDKPLCRFDTESAARAFREERQHVVPGLRLFCAVETITRRDLDAAPTIQRRAA